MDLCSGALAGGMLKIARNRERLCYIGCAPETSSPFTTITMMVLSTVGGSRGPLFRTSSEFFPEATATRCPWRHTPRRPSSRNVSARPASSPLVSRSRPPRRKLILPAAQVTVNNCRRWAVIQNCDNAARDEKGEVSIMTGLKEGVREKLWYRTVVVRLWRLAKARVGPVRHDRALRTRASYVQGHWRRYFDFFFASRRRYTCCYRICIYLRSLIIMLCQYLVELTPSPPHPTSFG